MKKLQILLSAVMIFTSRLYAFDICDFIGALKSQKIEQVAQLFEDGFDVNMIDNNKTLLMYVAMQSDWLRYNDYSSSFHCKVARMLLDAGVSINRANEYGETAIMTACSYDKKATDMNMIRLLIDNGANIHVRDNRGITTLMKAAYSGNIEVVKLLALLGVDPLLKNQYGGTALMSICSHVPSDKVVIDMNLIRLLIKQDTDVNARNVDGRTALMNAAYSGNIKAVKLLLQLGADPFMKNKDGKRALQLAKHDWTYHFEQGYVSRAQEKQIIAILKAVEGKNKK